MLSSRASFLLRPAARIRSITLPFSSAAVSGEDIRPSVRDPTALVRAVAGIAALAGAGLGLGLWMIPSSFYESSASVPDVSKQQIVSHDERQEKKPRFIFGESFRRRVFFNYEKRMRMRSPPEKIFEYFASIKNPEGEVYMSPADLMRAVIPVFPPSESDIVREGYLSGERIPGMLHCAPSTFFMLFDTNTDGLISFPEYILFVTLLSIPESSFSVAFKMFDLDSNGEIDKEEFKKVMKLMHSYNRQGSCHRDGQRIGLRVGRSENGGLMEYFFGKDGNGSLQHDEFVQFLRRLHDEIIRLEFEHYDFNSMGTIASKDFASSMVASADINHINRLLRRVDELSNHPHLRDMRISFEEFKAFEELRRKLHPLAIAIFSHGKVNGLLTKQDFKRAAFHVCGVCVTDNLVDIVFHVFDADCDGSLSSEEFLGALQRRESDIREPNPTGLMGLLSCCSNCRKSWSSVVMAPYSHAF